MQLGGVVRALKGGESNPHNRDYDHLMAWSASAGENPRELLDKLLDGQEPTEQYFNGAHPSE